jgi:hypothetical protein
MTIRPVLAVWNEADLAFKVEPRFAKLARAQFRDGDSYPLEIVEHRSSKEHSHMFAAIKDAFDHIQDADTLEVLSTPNKLRQWCLINSGWCDVTVFGPVSKQSAIKSAQMAAINFRKNDDYVEITIRKAEDDAGKVGWLVVIKTAKSQSRTSMKKDDFRASKKDILEVLAGTICVRRRDLEAAANRSTD